MYCNRPDGLFVHLACLLSIVNQFCKNDFLHLGLTAIHQPHPAHGVVCFQILGGPGLFCHSRHHAVQHIIGGVLGFKQMGEQLAAQGQAIEQARSMLFQIPQTQQPILAQAAAPMQGWGYSNLQLWYRSIRFP